jgi:hypothetical protein
MKHLLTLTLFFLAQHLASAQHGEAKATEHHGMKGSHRLTLGLGHAHTSQGEVDGETQWLALPSWSLNYDYWFSDRWAAGLQNDLILESFFIIHGDDEELERTKPLAVVPVALFKASEHFTLLGGVGVEFAHEKNLTLTRIGAEYGWHLPKNWEVGITTVWDGKWGYYNSWGLAFTASKIFPKKNH